MARVPGTDTSITEENGFSLLTVGAATGVVTQQWRSLPTASEQTPLVLTPVSTTAATGSGSLGASGCSVQKIDVATHAIAQRQTYTVADMQTVVRTLCDPVCGAPVAYTRPPAGASASSAGSRVQSFGF